MVKQDLSTLFSFFRMDSKSLLEVSGVHYFSLYWVGIYINTIAL